MIHQWLVLLWWSVLLLRTCSASSSQVLKRANCNANNPNIAILKQNVARPVVFCSFWMSGLPRPNTPFTALSADVVTNICGCISNNPTLVGTTSVKKPTNPQTTVKDLLNLQKDVSSPLPFCQFWLKVSGRQGSPLADIASPALSAVCQSVTANPSILYPQSTTTSTRTTTSSKQSTSSTKTSTTTSKVTSSSLSSTSSISPSKQTSQATKTSASSSSSISSASTTTSAGRVQPNAPNQSTTVASCAQQTQYLQATGDQAIDTTILAHVETSNKLVLSYGRKNDPNDLISARITFTMRYPAVALEHTQYISQVQCSTDYLTLVASNMDIWNLIAAWPDKDVAVITNSLGCNPRGERGVYLITSTYGDSSTLSFKFRVRSATWSDVASLMDITYTSTSAEVECAVDSPSPTSIIPTYTDRPNYDDLSDAAKEIVDYLASKITYDSDGNIVLYTPPEVDQPMASQVYTPDDAAAQAALDAALAAAGLDTPDDLIAQSKNSLAGNCHGTSQKSANFVDHFANTSASSTPSQKRGIFRRSWDDVWDVGCSDFVGAFTGDVGEAVCDAKDLYDSRDAIACMFSSCYSQASAPPPPPTYIYTFLYSWYASFFFPKNSAVVSFSDGSALTCTDCSYSISELKITGTITAVLATGEIKGATITVSESSNANMYFDLKTNSALSYKWQSALSTSNLDAITVAGVFNIVPAIIFSMGADFTTDGALEVQAGSGLNLNKASADIDLGTAVVSNQVGWNPGTNILSPVFTKAAHLEFYPYMRRLVQISFTVMGNKIKNTATLTSQTTLGFVADVDDTPGFCTADQMHLQTYLGTQQSLVFDNGGTKLLYTRSDKQAQKCFDVPSDKPTQDEIASLSAVGADFCTSYNRYIPPVKGLYTAATTTVPSTVTTTSTSIVITTPTVTVTTDATFTKTRVILTDTYATVQSVGTQALSTQFLKRDFTYAAMTAAPTPAAVARRGIPTPAIAATWDSVKLKYACSQIATGTYTYTVTTGTNTVTSGSVISTATAYQVAGAAAAVTSTSTNSHYTYGTSTSATGSVPLATSCPLQNQVSCFTLAGHGTPYIEGKFLNVREGVANPIFDDIGSAFYLTCDGALVSLPDMTVLTSSGNTVDSEIAFVNDWGSTDPNRATCSQDANNNQLNCYLGGTDLMYSWVPSSPYWSSDYFNVAPFQDSRVLMPVWTSPLGSESEYPSIYMTYAETECPCADPRTTTFAEIDTTKAACPQDDGLLYKTSDGTSWQIQCNTDYPGNNLGSITAADLPTCIAACDTEVDCVAAIWAQNGATCSLKYNAVNVASPNGPVHAVIKLAQKPTHTSVILNPSFEGGSSPWIIGACPGNDFYGFSGMCTIGTDPSGAHTGSSDFQFNYFEMQLYQDVIFNTAFTKTYQLSLWYKCITPADAKINPHLIVYYGPSSNVEANYAYWEPDVNVIGVWTQFTQTVNIGPGAGTVNSDGTFTVRFEFLLGGDGGATGNARMAIDDFSLIVSY